MKKLLLALAALTVTGNALAYGCGSCKEKAPKQTCVRMKQVKETKCPKKQCTTTCHNVCADGFEMEQSVGHKKHHNNN